MDAREQESFDGDKMQKFIDNCTALKMEPELVNKAYVYTTPEREYSQIWTKEDIHDNEPINYYYRIQILGLNKDGYDESGNYLFVQNWGAFDTINHRKRSDYISLKLCLKKFIIQSAARSRNFIFSKITENNISKETLDESVQELIAKYIFDVNFLRRMIDNEYTFDVQNKISAIFEADSTFKVARSQPQPTVNEKIFVNANGNPRVSYTAARDLLEKRIICEPTDSTRESTGFSLMNFYYNQLHTTIKVLDKNSDSYRIISKYFANSLSNHRNVCSMLLDNVFEIERPSDNHRYTKDLKNKQLLWHGTKMMNIPSILYEGFRTTVAKTGGRFGPGIYFANSASKSIQYCYGGQNILLLCEVALGEIMKCTTARNPLNCEGELPDGINSVHGVGNLTPNVQDSTIIDEDVLVPYGQPCSEHRYAVAQRINIIHDEFIVYNPAQIKMRYLISISKQSLNNK